MVFACVACLALGGFVLESSALVKCLPIQLMPIQLAGPTRVYPRCVSKSGVFAAELQGYSADDEALASEFEGFPAESRVCSGESKNCSGKHESSSRRTFQINNRPLKKYFGRSFEPGTARFGVGALTAAPSATSTKSDEYLWKSMKIDESRRTSLNIN